MFAAAVLSGTALASPLFTYSFEPTAVTGAPGTTPDGVLFLTQQLSRMSITTTQGQGFLSFDFGQHTPSLVIGITEFRLPGADYDRGFILFAPGEGGTGTVSIFAQGDHLTSGMIEIDTIDSSFSMLSIGEGTIFMHTIGAASFFGTWVLTGVTGAPEPGTMLLLLAAALTCLAYYSLTRRERKMNASTSSTRGTLRFRS